MGYFKDKYTQLSTAFEPYIVENLVQDEPDIAAGNGLLYSAEYVIALIHVLGCVPEQEKSWLIDGYYSHQVESGLMKRNIENGYGQESIDDYVGCGVFSYFVDGGNLAKKILQYGRKTLVYTAETAEDKMVMDAILDGEGVRYVYNNLHPGVFSTRAWLGRFYHLIGFLQFCAGEKVGLLRRLYMAANFIKSAHAKKHDYDRAILPWLMTTVVKDKGVFLGLAYLYWKWKTKKKYGNPGVLLRLYFRDKSHPLGKYLQTSSF